MASKHFDSVTLTAKEATNFANSIRKFISTHRISQQIMSILTGHCTDALLRLINENLLNKDHVDLRPNCYNAFIETLSLNYDEILTIYQNSNEYKLGLFWKYRLEKVKINQSELSKKLKISLSQTSNFINGYTTLPEKYMDKVYKIFNFTENEIEECKQLTLKIPHFQRKIKTKNDINKIVIFYDSLMSQIKPNEKICFVDDKGNIREFIEEKQ